MFYFIKFTIRNISRKLDGFESKVSEAFNNIENRLVAIEQDVSNIKKSHGSHEAALKGIYRLAYKIKKTTDQLSSTMKVRKKAQEILVLDRNARSVTFS